MVPMNRAAKFPIGGAMSYKIIEKHESVTDAPHLRRGDLITMTEAADLLGKSVFWVRNLLDIGRLRAVVDNETTTPHGTPKRYLIRADVEAMIGEQEPQL